MGARRRFFPMSDEAAARAPASAGEVFRVFTRLALQGFGGVLPVAQRVLVDQQRWLTREQFVETLALGQVLPGPNIVNMALIIGDRHFGLRGALAALGGLMLAPLAVVLLLAALYGQLHQVPAVAGALRGMGAVAAGLVVGTAVRMLPTLRHNALGLPAAAALVLAATLAIAWWRVSLVWVVLALGAVSMGWAARRLRR
jgi:chromate transporter